MRSLNFSLSEESYDEQVAANRCNPAYKLSTRYKSKDVSFTIGAGSSDTVFAFSEGNSIYVLTHNFSLEYAGVQEYHLD